MKAGLPSDFPDVFIKTICECIRQVNIRMSRVHCGSTVRFGRALPGYPITAQHLYAFSTGAGGANSVAAIQTNKKINVGTTVHTCLYVGVRETGLVQSKSALY